MFFTLPVRAILGVPYYEHLSSAGMAWLEHGRYADAEDSETQAKLDMGADGIAYSGTTRQRIWDSELRRDWVKGG